MYKCVDDLNNGEYTRFDITVTWVLPLIDKTTTPYVTETNLYHRVHGYDHMIQCLNTSATKYQLS